METWKPSPLIQKISLEMLICKEKQSQQSENFYVFFDKTMGLALKVFGNESYERSGELLNYFALKIASFVCGPTSFSQRSLKSLTMMDETSSNAMYIQ
jgi:hypothetical protein